MLHWVSLLRCERYNFHHKVWYRALSLRDACIRHSGIILTYRLYTFVPNVVSVTTSIAELAHGEKSRTLSITHSSPSLFDALGTEALALRNMMSTQNRR